MQLQEAILAAKGNAIVVHLLLTGMTTQGGNFNSTSRTKQPGNGGVSTPPSNKVSRNGHSKPLYQFAIPEEKRSFIKEGLEAKSKHSAGFESQY